MFLGIDIGTSGVKAVVLDADGQVAGQGVAPLTVQRPHPLWSEQAPEDWWTATNAAVSAIDPQLRAAVRGIGLAGQMHGATLLGADDAPLRPAILWNDGRSHAQGVALEHDVPQARDITGNMMMPGFTASKLRWVREHEPEVFARIATVLLPKDFVRLRMTGDSASDLSDSAGTLWLDVGARQWSGTMLDACGLTEAQMPRLFEGSQAAGTLRAEVAAAWGMARVPVAAGGGDNAAGAAGVGVVRDGDALLSLGTSGVIFVATRDFRPHPAGGVHAFCHCLPGLWHQMAVHLSAASCIDWVARVIGAADAPEVFARAERAGTSGGELFLPYLSGERTPHNDPEVRGAFLRLDHDSSGDRLAQAVLEGVGFMFADGLRVLGEAGTRIERLAVIGGGARSPYWGRILASAMEVPLVYLKGGEVGPALGAARLAQLAVDGGDPADVCAAPEVARVVEPEPALVAAFAEKKAAFRDAYRRVAPRSV